MRRRQMIGLAGAVAGMAALGRAARAGTSGVALIVPDFPSAPAGIAARLLQPALSAALGCRVIVDFRPGAGGIVGLMAGARASDDASVLTVLTQAIVAAPWLAARMDAEPGDFTPIGRISFTPEVLLVGAARPWHRLADLIAALRADPGHIRTSFDGAWTSAEIAEVMLLDRAGVAARPVPGPGVAAALRDLRLGFALRPLPAALAALAGGGLRALAVSAPARVAALPDVPTLREQGIDVALGSWLALAAPRGTAAWRLAPAQAALRRVLAEEGVRAALNAAGLPPAWLGPTATARAIGREYRALGALFTAAGVNVRQTAVAVR